MAVFTVGPGGDYTDLNTAIAGVANGDTVQILTTYSHPGTQVNVARSDVTIESETGNPADCVIGANGTYCLNFGSSLTAIAVTGITFQQNKTSGSRNAAYVNRSVVTFTDCVFEVAAGSGTAYGALYPGTGALFYRCIFDGKNTPGRGIQQTLNFTYGIDSCLFKNWGSYGILQQSGEVTIRNCTFYQPIGASSTVRGMFLDPVSATNVYNTVVYGGTGGLGVDIGVRVDSIATNNVKNVISYGGQTTDFDVGSATTANLYDQAAVTADGNPVFVNIGTDFHPDPSGLAYQNGDASFAPATDIEGNAFGTPPSIGCYAAAASGGGSAKAATEKSRAGLLPSPLTLNPY